MLVEKAGLSLLCLFTSPMTFVTQIEKALQLPDFDVGAARSQMSLRRTLTRPLTKTGQPRIGAVLCLLYPHQGALHVVLTKRLSTLRTHSGQVSFPGGKQDEGETLQETALRETVEEIGVDGVEIIGRISSLYIAPTDFIVHPFVGYYPQRPNFSPSPHEVERILEPSLTYLRRPSTLKTTSMQWGETRGMVPYFDVENQIVWGATAIMLNDFLQRWQQAMIDQNRSDGS